MNRFFTWIKYKLLKEKRPNTAIHPVYKKLVEKVAVINDRELFQFKNLLDMPIQRHDMATRFSTEFNMKVDAGTLNEVIETSLKAANTGNFTKVIGLLSILKEQTQILLSVEASYRLASCVYFWDDEDLTTYDYEIGDEKISLFRKMGFDDFFLSEPINRFLPQMNLSRLDLEILSKTESQIKNLLQLTLKDRQSVEGKQI